jgi:hypothetical protein
VWRAFDLYRLTIWWALSPSWLSGRQRECGRRGGRVLRHTERTIQKHPVCAGLVAEPQLTNDATRFAAVQEVPKCPGRIKVAMSVHVPGVLSVIVDLEHFRNVEPVPVADFQMRTSIPCLLGRAAVSAEAAALPRLPVIRAYVVAYTRTFASKPCKTFGNFSYHRNGWAARLRNGMRRDVVIHAAASQP